MITTNTKCTKNSSERIVEHMIPLTHKKVTKKKIHMIPMTHEKSDKEKKIHMIPLTIKHI